MMSTHSGELQQKGTMNMSNIRLFFLSMLAVATLPASVTTTSQAQKLAFTPLKIDLKELASPAGLNLSKVQEEVVPFKFDDGTTRNIRKRTFRFFSQRFLDEDWYHDAYLFEPVDLQDDDHDKAIILSHVYNNKIFDEMLDKYGLRSAAVVGVPVLIFKPNPVNQEFFKNHPTIKRSESQWQEFTFQLFRESGDINVTSFAVIMKAKWRALAAMDEVLGRKLTKVIYCGGSKGGAAVRAMLKEDPRIVSVVSSGSIPFGSESYLEQNKSKLYVRQFVDTFHLRPSEFDKSTIFFNIGTNDYNAPPTPVCNVYHSIRGDRKMYTQPNGGHPAIADEQVKAMQLWCSHVLQGTVVPEVGPPKITRHENHLLCRTTITMGKSVQKVELSYACFDPGAGKFTPGRRSPNAQWAKAKWTTIPMKAEDGAFVVKLAGDICDNLEHLHVSARAKVVDGQLVGYVSSPVYSRDSYRRYGSLPKRGVGQNVPATAPVALQAERQASGSRNRKATKSDYKSPDIHGGGRVTFSITVPGASRVDLVGTFSSGIDVVAMKQDERGIWRKTLEELKGGIYNYGFSINGSTLIADPLNHLVFSRKAEPTVWSMLEMPAADGSMFYERRDVPHGVVHSHLYRADSLSETRRVHVYTPPGYESTERKYPVLYLFHGGTNLADGFLVAGRVDMILDNLIAAGKAEPMIVVMPNASGKSPYLRQADGSVDRSRNFAEFEKSFFAETIPFVESKYRISRKREDHAVAGFSVGAALSRTVGLRHLDQFAWVGQFSGGGRLGDDYADTVPALLKDVEKTNRLLKLYWISGPTADRNLPPFHQRLKDAGIEYVSRPDRFGHSYRTCRYILNEDFLPRLFKSGK